jgi:Holliday junction resolvasome RuvABC ATP-dependent DNA helicase subunit
MMFKPLLNRCEEINFKRYTEEELFAILKLYLLDMKITANKDEVAEACRGRGRDAFKLSQNIKRYTTMKKTRTLDDESWDAIKDLMGIWPKGLHNKEVDFMKILLACAPISSRNLAIKMGLNINNIEDELEIRPRELGMIESTSKGRQLTEFGKAYLNTVKVA